MAKVTRMIPLTVAEEQLKEIGKKWLETIEENDRLRYEVAWLRSQLERNGVVIEEKKQ